MAVTNHELANRLSGLPPLWIIGLALIILWRVYTITYNIFFHPLRDFPGPLLRRASRFPYAIGLSFGTGSFSVQKLHEKYGPVVRIAPNHLSFTEPEAWRDIYGPLGKNKSSWPEMPKSRTFTTIVAGEPDSIINADYPYHQVLRRALSHGFSEASLRLQEPVVKKYTDLLLERMREMSENGQKPVDMTALFNWTTFDITGELIFGQNFECLEKREYHPYIGFLLAGIKAAAKLVAVIYLGHRWLAQVVLNTVGGGAIRKTREIVIGVMDKRFAMGPDQNDLLEELISRKEDAKLTNGDITANGFLLAVAGSETSATTLAGITYLLGTHPDALKKLTEEVRSTFSSHEEVNINQVSVGRMPYLNAVISESMRLYPAVVGGLIRVIPPEGRQIAGRYVPGSAMVEVQPWSVNYSEANWVDPSRFDPGRWLVGEAEARKMATGLKLLSRLVMAAGTASGEPLP